MDDLDTVGIKYSGLDPKKILDDYHDQEFVAVIQQIRRAEILIYI